MNPVLRRFIPISGPLSALALFCLLHALPAHAAWPPPEPAEPVLSVVNSTAFARDAELVRAGVPIPRSRNLLSTAGLAVLDDGGNPVPASFVVLARWNAARTDAGAPVQWLLVRFPASVAANASRSFRLRMDGSIANPPPGTALQLTSNGSQVTVNTGAARFELGGSVARVFDRIELPGGNAVATSSAATAAFEGGALQGLVTLRRVVVEHADALSAVVIVEGEYAHPQIGGGAISGGRRLEFSAGSSAVTVREWIDWEGARCAIGEIDCGANLNALSLERWRVALTPALAGARTISLQSTLAQPAASALLAAGQEASLRQRRRAERGAVQRFEQMLPGSAATNGARADAGVALLSGSNGALGLALRAMPDYEPQALRVLADGSLAADLADERVWIGARQGAFAEYRIGAFASGTSAATAAASLWPALNAPLIALPAAPWIAASRATDEFPVGDLPPALASFDTLLQDLVDRTIALRRDRGLEGLMTFGLFPRNWGNPILSDEIDCGGNDPTPGDDWDDPYWCAFWTDYHNTSSNAFVAAWRFRDPRPLYTLSHPAAMRQLHTQMIRCAPDDEYFYCGQLPTGYRGYRSDFNSSHAYVENLILTYWTTGDLTILERLQRGARSYRGYVCPTRGSVPPGPVCAPNAPITDEFAGLNDRVATQFHQVFRFVGLAGDPSYLEDWRSNVARALTQNFALANFGGDELGFTEPSGGGDTSIIAAAGTYYTTQLWMASIYDFNGIYRLQVDSQDAPLGSPAIAPSRAQQAWARMLVAASQNPPGDGTAAGVWPNSVRFTFSGARVGGTITSLQPGWAPGPQPIPCLDDCLYDTGKSGLTAVLARSADSLEDPTLRAATEDLVQFALDAIEAQRMPMGKIPGELFGRLTSAVARLALAPVDPNRVFEDGFEE